MRDANLTRELIGSIRERKNMIYVYVRYLRVTYTCVSQPTSCCYSVFSIELKTTFPLSLNKHCFLSKCIAKGKYETKRFTPYQVAKQV